MLAEYNMSCQAWLKLTWTVSWVFSEDCLERGQNLFAQFDQMLVRRKRHDYVGLFRSLDLEVSVDLGTNWSISQRDMLSLINIACA